MIAELMLSLVQKCAPFGGGPVQNVVLVIADDFGWTERALMPSLDQIAMRGVTFERAYTFPLCSLTREAIFHGEYPRRIGLGGIARAHDGDTQPCDRLSLAEALGMDSLLVGKYHLGRAAVLPDALTSGAFADGFERWLAGSVESINRPHTGAGYYDWHRVDDALTVDHETIYATDAQLLAWQSAWSSGFGVLSWSAPHSPYDTPPGYTQGATTRERYEDIISYLDAAVATVLAGIDWQTTLVIFLGDNGTPNDARPIGSPAGRWKNTTMEGGIRVPLIIGGAGVTATGTSQRLVSALDIGETVLEMVGREAPRGLTDSRSFADALGVWTGSAPRSWIFSERYDVPDDQAIVTGEWKLRIYDADGPGFSPPSTTIYHLPDQTAYTPSEQPAVYAELSAHLATLPARQ